MKTKRIIVDFVCDRCGTKEERNINEHSGELLSFTSTHDMQYGNNTRGEYDLCQKCTKDFNRFMNNKDELKELRHFHDTNVGLFATDRPDLVDDTKYKVLFEVVGIHKG